MMAIESVSLSPFEGFGMKIGAKETSREALHEIPDCWIDEVEWMTEGAGLDGIVEKIFKKRQELMGKIVRQIIEEQFFDELNRETMVCLQCGKVLTRRGMPGRTVETMIGETRLTRPYFYCENCKDGFYPLDDALILSDRVIQWDMQEVGASVAAEVPYNTAEELFEKLTGMSMAHLCPPVPMRRRGKVEEGRRRGQKERNGKGCGKKRKDSGYILWMMPE